MKRRPGKGLIALLVAGIAGAGAVGATAVERKPMTGYPSPQVVVLPSPKPDPVQRLGPSAETTPEPVGVRAAGSVGDNPVRAAVPEIDYHPSTALGQTNAGTLMNGTLLPPRGADYLTWDPILQQRPNREWRRWGTDTLIRQVLRIASAYRADNPAAPPLLIGDISRPKGGDFGKRFGGIGHASHQNGLDIDIYYPRRDRAPRAPLRASQVDMRLSQDLVDRFLALRPEFIFVGPSTPFSGPRKIVVPLVNHDNHLHLRIRNPHPQG